ncbi:Uncharacterised protein [Leclercia adecarboxylata]|nr:Uncharacterised protein [Leclercia adecarboxylata]
MPGDGGVHVVEQPFADHKGFTRAALFTGAAIKAHRAAAAVLLQPALHRHGTRQGGGAEQVMTAAVAVGTRSIGLRGGAMCLLA